MDWQKVNIEMPAGTVEAIAPHIISASRSTDIPAFYAEWFLNRLRAGYACWTNPFNRKKQYVSFEKTRAVVFWSKNPAPMMACLDDLDRQTFTYYFQFTVNDYLKEGFEPNVPDLRERVQTFQALSKRLGKERVIWRFDPLLLTKNTTVADLLTKIENVGDQLHIYTEKLVFSFADISQYQKVQRNLKRATIEYDDFTSDTMHSLAGGLSKLGKKWGIKVATCGEIVSLKEHQIEHNKCIDDDLLARIAPHDKELMTFLGRDTQLDLFGSNKKKKKLKDKGQREECGCISSKDIGMYNTCGHLCVYCYANTSEEAVRRNLCNVNKANASILPV